jgi:hypothetical protein
MIECNSNDAKDAKFENIINILYQVSDVIDICDSISADEENDIRKIKCLLSHAFDVTEQILRSSFVRADKNVGAAIGFLLSLLISNQSWL